MTAQTLQRITKSAGFAFVSAITIVMMAFIGFIIAEPQVGHTQETFTIRQTITDETTFSTTPTNVVMAGNISGITGGNSTGTTQFAVQSNNATGYLVTIAFENDDPGQLYAMLGDTTGSNAIADYENDDTNEPSFGFGTTSDAAVFAYTVTSTTTTDTDNSFANNTVNACNEPDGGSPDWTEDVCWKAPTTTSGVPFNIIDRSSAAITGATSTIKFRVHVPPNASPVPTAETYTATATLTLTTQ